MPTKRPPWTGLANRVRRALWLLRHRRHFSADGTAHRRPRLHVDLSVILERDAHTGIQRVVRAIWLGLRQREAEGADPLPFDLVPVCADRRAGYRHARGGLAGERLPDGIRHGDPVGMAAGDMFLGLDLAAHLLPEYRSQIRAWRRAGASVAIVAYDLLPLTHPQFFRPITTRRFIRWLALLRAEADLVACISEDVARQVDARLASLPGDRPPPKVRAFPLGSDIAATAPTRGVPENAAAILQQIAASAAVLVVGTIEPRKGHQQVLDAFDILWSRGDETLLVIVGRPGWLTQDIQARLAGHPERGRRLHWFDNASDELLQMLYDACKGVLVASHAEGFGLPLVEAARNGRPVLCRDLPVFRECAEGQVSFYTAATGAELANAVAAWLAGRHAGDGPAARPAVSWQDSVSALVDLLDRRGPSPSSQR